MDYENQKTIDFTVHESIMARMERANKRWFYAWLVTFLLLCACVCGFIWFEAQFEDIEMTQEATTDGGGNAIVNGAAGDLYYGTGETDNQDQAAQDGR